MKRGPVLILFLVAVALASAAKVAWNSLRDSEDDPREVFSYSMSEARRSGILVTPLVAVVSRDTEVESGISIAEAWLEQCAVHRYSMLWLHRRVATGGFTLVIKLANQADPRFALWPPERQASFSWVNGRYFFRYFEHMPQFPMIVVGGTKELVPVATLKRPNQSSEPTPTSVTISADAEIAPAAVVAVMRRL